MQFGWNNSTAPDKWRVSGEIGLLDRVTFMQTAEDVVIMKLRWTSARRPKDIEDIRNVISTSGYRMDWNYVYSWCDRHGTRELLDEIRRSIPAG